MNRLKVMVFHILKNRGLLGKYNELLDNLNKPYDSLLYNQNQKLQEMIKFSYTNVPYYNRLFKSKDINPNEIKSIKDLSILPVITKKEIKDNIEDFYSTLNSPFVISSTGGTTGNALTFRVSKEDIKISKAILYRGWSYAGYQLGDSMITIAGSSLVPSSKSKMQSLLLSLIHNNYQLSSYNMTNETILSYIHLINKVKPKFIRGYASSLNEISKFAVKNDIKLHKPNAIFSTAEMLSYEYRHNIEGVFKTKVFDQYGLNDGGVTAFECSHHDGYHIDIERSILEIVDEDGNPVNEGEEGRVIATSLNNYAMPFIRYETGDIAIMKGGNCNCGIPFNRLDQIIGRTDDFILTNTGKRIHSGFIRMILKKVVFIDEFQVVQDNKNEIKVNIVLKDEFKEHNQEDIIDEVTKIIKRKFKVNEIDLGSSIQIVNEIQKSKSGKLRFFISNI